LNHAASSRAASAKSSGRVISKAGTIGNGSGLKLSNLPRSGWQQAASGFLSVDTRFGPFFLALGTTRRGETPAYLLLGPTW